VSIAKAALPSFGVPVPGALDRADYSVTEKGCTTSLGRGNAMSVIDPHTDVLKRPPPWDEYWTFGWLLLVLLLYLIPAVILAVVFNVDYRSGGGLVWIIVLYAVQIGAVTLLARLADWPAKEYLSLVRPNGRDTVIAIVSVALFIPAWHALAFVLEIHSSQTYDLYRNAQTIGILPLYWFVAVVVAPVAEEIVFRGFLFRGLTGHSQIIASFTTSLVWASTHVGMAWSMKLQVVLLGLLLGWMRWRSGSVVLPMLMHGLWNLWVLLRIAYILD
jgi:CAAX protease family protein